MRQWGNPEVRDDAFWDSVFLGLAAHECLRLLSEKLEFRPHIGREYDHEFAESQ